MNNEKADVLSGDKPDYGNKLKVTPTTIIKFFKEENNVISRLQLQNLDTIINLAYKMKTTYPEKFRVHPPLGCIPPGDTATVIITLNPGFQLEGKLKDQFLVLSMPVESVDLSVQELIDIWKNTSNKKISRHMLYCSEVVEDRVL